MYRTSARPELEPACFYCGGAIREGFCAACMTESLRAPSPPPSACLRCERGALAPIAYGPVAALMCERCKGLFFDGPRWDTLVGEIRAGAAIPLAEIVPPPPGIALTQAELLKRARCPACHALMERTVFGALSSINVDVCPRHGLWLDAGEIVGVVEFVRRVYDNNGALPIPAEELRDQTMAREYIRFRIEEDELRRKEEERRKSAELLYELTHPVIATLEHGLAKKILKDS
jgi:Zn-finger nucleic acid-binding protein